MAKLKTNIMAKVIIVGALALIMLIPLFFVNDTINNRADYRGKAESEFEKAWGGEIISAAPILNIPYLTKTEETASGKSKTVLKQEYAKFAPANLEVKVNIDVQKRYIGIFETPVFTADVEMIGEFEKLSYFFDRQDMQNAFITIELSDLKGISDAHLEWNSKNYEFEPSLFPTFANIGSRNKDNSNTLNVSFSKRSRTGHEFETNSILKALSAKSPFVNAGDKFKLNFKIKGIRSLSFVPLAKNNSFEIVSNWSSPSFGGYFLPEHKEVNKNGFNARWNINYLASGIPQRFDGKNLKEAIFTVNLLVPVDNYRNVVRAQKYGFLFIILTFTICFVFETVNKKPIHPFQYLLVGFAMSVFYVLLLSLSEFMYFSLSYLIAAAATIVIISAYAKFSIAKTMTVKQTAAVSLSLSFLYGYLFMLLQLENFALLCGSIGLFAAVSLIMYMTKDINWYEEQ
jgi:inner membrane protein